MKPKISTGYLTPQVKKTKAPTRSRLSESDEMEKESEGLSDDFFEAILKCPEKKKLVLQLLTANKEAIDKYKQKSDVKTIASPLRKVKGKMKICESPTAMLRRRALQQINSSPSTSDRSNSSKHSSRASESSSSSPVPFEKVLHNVIAYVEIRSKQDADRSEGAKAVLRSMGAIVRETFTNDVTHVIFKDGSYNTFRKARLRKIHLVSILWVEFCRKTSQRQSEKQYPALKSGFDDETMICSQMQKEYEDIIREEYRRSIIQGTPLPTTQSLIDRRRTLMTPSVSNSNLNTSSSSFKTAAESIQESQNLSDQEVASINGLQDKENMFDEGLIMNDPKCFSEVSGPVVNGSVVEQQIDASHGFLKFVGPMECSDMELTHIISKSPIKGDMRISDTYKTPKLNYSRKGADKETPNNRSKLLFDRRKTICDTLLSSDSSTRSLISPNNSSNNTNEIRSDKSSNLSATAFFAPANTTSKRSRRLTRGSSNSLLESESFVFGRNSVKAKKVSTVELDKTASAISELKLSSNENVSNSANKSGLKTSTETSYMSSLRLSSESKKRSSSSNLKLSDVSKITGDSFAMSSLRVSSDSLNKSDQKSSSNSNVHKSSISTSKSSMSSLRLSSERPLVNRSKDPSDCSMPSLQISSAKEISQKNDKNENESGFTCSEENNVITIKPAIDNIVKSLEKSKFITFRKNTRRSALSRSPISDDSEIISPSKNIRNSIRKNNKKLNTIENEELENISVQESSKRLEEDLAESYKKNLVVNIEKSPLDDLNNSGILNYTRRKTLGTRRQQKSSSTSENRKTVNSKRTQIYETDESKKLADKTADSEQNDTNTTDLSKANRKCRKLYNPGDSIHIDIDDEREREEKRNQVQKRKLDEGVFINSEDIWIPEILLNKTPPNEITSDIDINYVTPPKRTRKAKKKADEVIQMNSSADEQKDLLNELLTKKTLKARKSKSNVPVETPSRRKSTRIIKPTVKSSQNEASGIEKTPFTPRNRLSTLEFMSLSQVTSSRKKSKTKLDKIKLPTIVCTKLHKSDVQVFTKIVRKLGRFNVEDEVSDKTTHVVAGEPKRTINMLRAISRGCWILRFEWVLRSLEQGKWLPEEDFEVIDFSPIVKKCRLERQAFGAKYTLDVFESCPPIYVASCTNPRCSDLKELITTCKGTVVTAARMARIIVGQFLEQEDTVCVNETWVLDCITFYKKMPFKTKYLVKSKRQSLFV